MPETRSLRIALGFFILAGLCTCLLDAAGKAVVGQSGLLLLVWSRYVGHLVFSIPVARVFAGPAFYKTKRPRLQLARSVLLGLTSVLFFAGLMHMPLAEASAIAFTTPIWVALLSWKVLGEAVHTIDRWIAAIGFAGVLLIIRPGTDVFHPVAFLVLAMAILNAVYQLITRKLTEDSAFTTFFYSPIVGAVFSSALMVFVGLPDSLPLSTTLVLISTGILGGLGHLFIILAFYRAPAARLTPFVYLQMIWAILLGWILFGQLPDQIALLGMAVIVGSGLFLILHRRRAK